MEAHQKQKVSTSCRYQAWAKVVDVAPEYLAQLMAILKKEKCESEKRSEVGSIRVLPSSPTAVARWLHLSVVEISAKPHSGELLQWIQFESPLEIPLEILDCNCNAGVLLSTFQYK